MVALLAKQHLLPSSIWLLGRIADAQLFTEIGLVTKGYSDIERVVTLLPSSVAVHQSAEQYFNVRAADRLVLLDEGGGLHEALPTAFGSLSAGMEQTTSGLRTTWKCPMVLVCRSAAKLFFEFQVIARGIMRKLQSLQLLTGASIGVIGLGALGSEIARILLDRGILTLGSEIGPVPPDLKAISVPLEELVRSCNVILGCTGVDVLQGTEIGSIGGHKVFASCSSNDVEFRSVLVRLPDRTRFGSAKGVIGDTDCTVLNGGFPINFDRRTEWEAFDEIVLTRELCLAGLVQANNSIGGEARGLMLDPSNSGSLLSGLSACRTVQRIVSQRG